MTQQEFTQLAKFEVSQKEYSAIEEVYMNCDLDKYEFCKMWRKMNAKRIKAHEARVKERKEQQAIKEGMKAIDSRLDFYTYAEIKPFGVLFLTSKERAIVEKAGISLYEDNSGQYRDMIDVIIEIKDYAQACK